MIDIINHGSLEITPKIGCSVMCEYCPQTLLIKSYTGSKIKKADPKKKPILNMEFDSFKKYISTVPTSIDLHFTGYVEPFLNKDCDKFILYSHNKGHKIMVNTTLEGFSLEKYEGIKNLPYKQFNIHCPSSTYKENIGVKKPPSFLETGQRELREDWLELLIYIFNDPPQNFTLHYHGGLHPQVKELFKYAGVDYKKYTKSLVTSDRAQNLVDGGDNIIQHSKVPPEKNIRGKSGRVYQPVLIPDGSLGLCCQDYGLKHVAGNLNTQTWQEYRKSPAFLKIAQEGADLCDYCLRTDDNYSN
jgi:hypothetical protein